MSTKTDQPATFAEGAPVPTNVPESVEAVRAAATKVPTAADYEREHGTYRATAPLYVGASLAVNTGGSVPASHPYLRDQDHIGPGWVEQEIVELTGDYEAPEDLKAVHAAIQARRDTEEK